jgi:hypothetical protein
MYPSHNDDFPEIHCILSSICNVLLGWRSIGGAMSFGRLSEMGRVGGILDVTSSNCQSHLLEKQKRAKRRINLCYRLN